MLRSCLAARLFLHLLGPLVAVAVDTALLVAGVGVDDPVVPGDDVAPLRMTLAACSATTMTMAWVLPVGRSGWTEASTT